MAEINVTKLKQWPPMTIHNAKMREHSAWYSGDPKMLASFYSNFDSAFFLRSVSQKTNSFWARQVTEGELFMHVPIAGDIAAVSADFLFAESPIIRIADLDKSESLKKTQEELDTMLMETGFFSKLLEAAEACAAIGGVFIKIAWDEEISPYPIPVIVQADQAIPEFKFGELTAVTFWQQLATPEEYSNINADVAFRLLERYEKGKISYMLFKGTYDKLGEQIDLSMHPDSVDLPEEQATIDELLAVYIPNMLPNKLDRSSYLGRSDYQGLETLMDKLDETFTAWMRDVFLAKASIHIPESYLRGDSTTDQSQHYYSVEKMLYVKMDVDPTSESTITATQFAIRADEFEKTVMTLLERIITSAGYSPQSFGLNIQGRAESGTALSMRERKSFATKGKKENYWAKALKRLVKRMIMVYRQELGGQVDDTASVNISFSDGITNNLNEIANSVKLLSDAMAVSVDTKVRLIHSDWDEEQIKKEVDRIMEENGIGMAAPPEGNKDIFQLDNTDPVKGTGNDTIPTK